MTNSFDITRDMVSIILHPIAILIALFPVITKVLQFLASGNLYRIKISKSDTNLNIVEKLLGLTGEDSKVKISQKTHDICNTVIEESVFHIQTGCKTDKRNFDVYDAVIDCTGLKYLACFATKLVKPGKDLRRLCWTSIFIFPNLAFLAIVFSAWASAEIGVILSKTSSQTSIVLDVKQWIELVFYSVMAISSFVLYIFSFNRFANSLVLLWHIKENKALQEKLLRISDLGGCRKNDRKPLWRWLFRSKNG
ncbi:hypothetical protein HFU84_02395 [Acidithiobacillus sp. CV18-2]|uniref:hypothetical protein n=1 Tax=Acidithiobacillus caldus TaxID=33059 RepID=UPI001C0759B0|nr:hypothetical protein [Acidithiobacillus caldus]MBU2753107.1 hypothetical protein [Acidithiobacillus sp. CV18-3]MBU2757165.1 hypothetical protein [Acidithiobacillus sp. BN09-2]MBU2776380.1 hypothetical protein [Acidithiobacillus sp. CV18-2]MBU2798978.1 hypothetical protein [Acidithiobacillus sp. VAN18-4]MBU2770417.1 hypothetical protein [Acidithiobacillus caldus]